MRKPFLALWALALLVPATPAQDIRPVPPPGIAVPPAERAELEAGLKAFQAEIAALKVDVAGKPALQELLPDVELFEKGVRYALQYNEFFNAREFAAARAQLKLGSARAKELRDGAPSWPNAPGLIVRGYRSAIDGSVQPYGLVVPKGYDGSKPTRLDFWWHGRGETLSEVEFVRQRLSSPGEFAPANAIVLHPYGRYCNANKFAGETDTLECLAHAKKHYNIDANRVVARGFSMGGAACWQFATHYPTLWAAAAPGAGFAETPQFTNIMKDKVPPTWYEQKLWHLHNATDYAANLSNVPTVAYSGEIDRQKQAADAMAAALQAEGLPLEHVIGPKTAHSYEAKAKIEVAKRVDNAVAHGRDRFPQSVNFTTFTLRYNRADWVEVEGLGKHWTRARVKAAIGVGKVTATTENVTRLTLRMPGAHGDDFPSATIDGETVPLTWAKGEGEEVVRLERDKGKWRAAKPAAGLVKKPGLQGPIDDAFMSRFVIVRPTGKPLNDAAGKWVDSELKRAVAQWRAQFRGDAVTVDDARLTDEQIKGANLALWGDPRSNAALAKVAGKLPVKWAPDGSVEFGGQRYAPGHVPVLVFPNPLNPERYVVLNSGFTFRGADNLNNARQVAKLPDYAVVDTGTPPDERQPGKVVRAGFFGEKWELLANDGRDE